ncbi:MAG: hypothetical protein N4A47_04545 [Clostridia bacterium]|jgi:regulatory protein YycI of two-component signal transduction system YycFG|nr:hypothetical protein [Clostridia bacterium]
MNTKFAKRTLIIIFLFINIFLSTLHKKNYEEKFILSEDRINNIFKYLGSNDIKIEEKILPMNIEKREQVYFEIENLEFESYDYTDGIDFFKNSGVIIYKNVNEKKIYENISEKEVLILTDKFIKENAINGLELSTILKGESYYTVEYNGYINNEPIYDMYGKFIVSDAGILSAKVLTPNYTIVNNSGKSVVFADEILFEFAKVIKLEERLEKIEIRNVTIGYSLDKSSKLEDEAEGRGIPYYRVLLNDGTSYYFNAYTGKYEKEKSENLNLYR